MESSNTTAPAADTSSNGTQAPAPTTTTTAAAPADTGGTSRMNLELPFGELERVKEYARDKGVTSKYVIQRALTLYFDKVNEKEGGKYALQAVDKRDIV